MRFVANNRFYINTAVLLSHFREFALSDTENYKSLGVCRFLQTLFLPLLISQLFPY
jgi:hypothetical protein